MKTPRHFARWSLLVAAGGISGVLALGVESAGCANTNSKNTPNFDLDTGGFDPDGASDGFSPDSTTAVPCTGGKCTDFPAAPIFDVGAPPNSADLFGPAGSGTPGSGP